MRNSFVSNYDVMRDAMEAAFLAYNQSVMIDKYGLSHNQDFLFISFVGITYRINRFTGRVEYPSATATAYLHADYNVSMTIYQPRRQNISTFEISKDELHKWADEVLKPTADLAFAGDGNFLCGEWCGFCKPRRSIGRTENTECYPHRHHI